MNEQLNQMLRNKDEKMDGLQKEITQIQLEKAAKIADQKRAEDKFATLLAKYEKVKEKAKRLRIQNWKRSKLWIFLHVLFEYRRRMLLGIGTGGRILREPSADHDDHSESSDEYFDEVNLDGASFEAEMTAELERSSSVQETRMRARSRSVSTRKEAPPILRTKAMVVLERKEREEEEGTYIGGPKKLFCPPHRRPHVHPLAPTQESGQENEESDSNAANSAGQTDCISNETITAEQALENVRVALRAVIAESPLSPITDVSCSLTALWV